MNTYTPCAVIGLETPTPASTKAQAREAQIAVLSAKKRTLWVLDLAGIPATSVLDCTNTEPREAILAVLDRPELIEEVLLLAAYLDQETITYIDANRAAQIIDVGTGEVLCELGRMKTPEQPADHWIKKGGQYYTFEGKK